MFDDEAGGVIGRKCKHLFQTDEAGHDQLWQVFNVAALKAGQSTSARLVF